MKFDQAVPMICGDNISLAWAKAFLQCLETPDKILYSAVVRLRTVWCGSVPAGDRIRHPARIHGKALPGNRHG